MRKPLPLTVDDSRVPLPRKGKRKALTLAEYRALYAEASETGLREQLIVRLLYEVALRAAEVGALRLDHLKLLHEQRLYLPRGKGSAAGWTQISRGLAGLLRQWTTQAYGLQMPVEAAAAQWPELPVFPGSRRTGRRTALSRQQVWRMVAGLCERCDIPAYVRHPHALRHARAQHLFEAAERKGLDASAVLQTVAKVLGHRVAQTAWEHYIAETGQGKEIANAVLQDALGELEDGE